MSPGLGWRGRPTHSFGEIVSYQILAAVHDHPQFPHPILSGRVWIGGNVVDPRAHHHIDGAMFLGWFRAQSFTSGEGLSCHKDFSIADPKQENPL
jgi:hypothetical protein